MSFLLDTNVISEIRRRDPDPNVRRWFSGVPTSELYLSVLVLGEISQGIERLRRRDPSQAVGFSAWLQELRAGHADRLLPVTLDIAELWGRLNAPDPLPVVDGLLAATAMVHSLTLVTRNTSQVSRTGVALLNPFVARA